MDTYSALTTAITSSAPAILNEFCELLRLEAPVYDLTELTQRGVGSEFSATVHVVLGDGSRCSANGMASTKRHAKAAAALNLLISLPRVPPLHDDPSNQIAGLLVPPPSDASRPASYAAALLQPPAAAGSKRERPPLAAVRVETSSASSSDGVPPSPAHKRPQTRMTPRSAAFVHQALPHAEGETAARPAGATPEVAPVAAAGSASASSGVRDTRSVDFVNVDGNARKLAATQCDRSASRVVSSVVKQVWAPTPLFMRNAFRWAATFTNEEQALHASASVATSATVTPPDATPGSDAPVSTPGSSLRVHLRLGVSADVGSIMGMIRELAEFEREPEAVVTTEETMLRDGFGATPLFHVLLAEVDEEEGGTGESPRKKVVAMAVCYVGYSTWEGRMLYLEDLYIKPAYRRYGISKLLFLALARAAKVSKCARMQWSALEWNTPAIQAYMHPRIAATLLKEWQLFRLYADGIARVAQLPVVA